MPMMLIRQDEQGAYVITNGTIYRPQQSATAYYNMNVLGHTRYTKGVRVKGHHISQSPFAQVGDEIWAGHGPSPELLALRLPGEPAIKLSADGIAWNPAWRDVKCPFCYAVTQTILNKDPHTCTYCQKEFTDKESLPVLARDHKTPPAENARQPNA